MHAATVFDNCESNSIQPNKQLNIAIVGAGISGLYAARLSQLEGHRVQIFETSDRIGGRIRTHYFTHEDNQYYEAGAMRIPHSDFHTLTFDLVEHLQSLSLPSDKRIEWIPYVLNSQGNELLINGNKQPGARVSDTTPASLGWEGVSDEFLHRTAGDLMQSAIGHFLQALHDDFDQGFEDLLQFDHLSFRQYLGMLEWPESVIQFVEAVTSQTNQFHLSVTELVMQNMDFNTKDWSTIANGMSRLPAALAHVVGYRNITFGTRVTSIREELDERVSLEISKSTGQTYTVPYDRVILAIPPAAARMIDHPRWGPSKETALRAMHFEPLYKMGLRFKTRFWERVVDSPSFGGQTATDMPIRWVVFPSNGIESDGPGVLLVYSWMTDANAWLPLSPSERRDLALKSLARLFDGRKDIDGNVIDVRDLFIESADTVWSNESSTGDAMFLPGQFKSHYEAARRPEGNVFFAGEHLSRHHTWIAGALESTLDAVRSAIGRPDLQALRGPMLMEGSALSSARTSTDTLVMDGLADPKVPEKVEAGPKQEALAAAPVAMHPHWPLHLVGKTLGGTATARACFDLLWKVLRPSIIGNF